VSLRPTSEDHDRSRRFHRPATTQGGKSDVLSPALYDLVMWGFVEENASGERVLRHDIQARLDGEGGIERDREDAVGKPLYVGYRCEACWEAAVNLIAYGQHLCLEQSTCRCSDHSSRPV
jgi:hypothetical protein